MQYILLFLTNTFILLALAQEASAVLRQRWSQHDISASIDFIVSDVMDHYRTFQMLEKLLQYPTKFSEQMTYQIEPEEQRHLIEK